MNPVPFSTMDREAQKMNALRWARLSILLFLAVSLRWTPFFGQKKAVP